MKFQKIIIVVVMIFIGFSLLSCGGAYNPVNRLEGLTEELEENSSYYTADDWSYAIEEYEQIETELAEYSYSEEEMKEIARMRGKCYAFLLQGAAVIAKDGLVDQLDYIENIMAGFEEGVGNQIDNFENTMEDYEEELDNRLEKFENAVDEFLETFE